MKEKDEILDYKEEIVIGFVVFLGIFFLINVILCLIICYYYIIFKEESIKKKD